MIINLQNSGVAQILTPDHLYQGSGGVNKISVIGALPSSTAIGLAFRLPSGVETVYAPATLIGAVENVVNGDGVQVYEWEYTLPLNILSESGTVRCSINALMTGGNQTSYAVQFTVDQSILPDLPATPDQSVYELILQYLATDEANILDLQQRVTALETAVDTAETDIDDLQTRMAVAESDIDTAQNDIIAAENNIASLLNRMDTAEGDIDTAQADITANSQAIANEVTARQTADTAETTARENADTLLSGRIGAIEQTVGNESIAEIAPTITAALNSLNEDVDALQSGVVPRINRGIIEYSAPTIVPSAELVALMNAKILELFNRTPNNTDKLTVKDTDGENIGTYYTYNYWLGFTEVTDGWYWDSISVTAPINETPSYSQNVLTTSWGTAVNGMYNIEIPSTTHGQGTDNKITVEFKLLNTSGTYEPIQLYNVSGSGTVTLYTDTPFSGIVVIKAGTATYLTESTFEESQVVGLVGDLTAIRGDITALESAVDTAEGEIDTAQADILSLQNGKLNIPSNVAYVTNATDLEGVLRNAYYFDSGALPKTEIWIDREIVIYYPTTPIIVDTNIKRIFGLCKDASINIAYDSLYTPTRDTFSFLYFQDYSNVVFENIKYSFGTNSSVSTMFVGIDCSTASTDAIVKVKDCDIYCRCGSKAVAIKSAQLVSNVNIYLDTYSANASSDGVTGLSNCINISNVFITTNNSGLTTNIFGVQGGGMCVNVRATKLTTGFKNVTMCSNCLDDGTSKWQGTNTNISSSCNIA